MADLRWHGVKLIEAHPKHLHVFVLPGSMLIQITAPERLYTYSPLSMIFLWALWLHQEGPLFRSVRAWRRAGKLDSIWQPHCGRTGQVASISAFVVFGLSWASWKVFSFRHSNERL